MRHDDTVKQRVADGHIAVVSHHGEHVTLGNDKNKEEVELRHAPHIGNDVLLGHKIDQHFRSNGRGVTEIHK
jgi:hypothetical protein